MRQQTLYRGNDNKKAKLSKAEKVHIFVQSAKRKALAALSKKEATSH